jgi:hypothetical protein
MKAIAVVVSVLVFTAGLGLAAVENKGPEKITLNIGGERGEVHFPHHRHQNKLGDCNICHAFFPQEQDAIERLKKDGKLVPKQIMNKLCIKCHKAEKQAGHSAGPVTCSKCHQKG